MPNVGNTVVSKVLGKSGIILTKSGVSDGEIFVAPNVAPFGGEEYQHDRQWVIYSVQWEDTTISHEVRDEDFGGTDGLNNNGNILTDGRNILPSSDTLPY